MTDPAVPSLVVITDRHAAARAGRTVPDTVAAALDGGAPAVLLRDKDLPADDRRGLGETLRPLIAAADALLLVSSDVELARHLDADGVHLAADDPSVPAAAGDVDVPRLVGRSCHDVAEVELARREGADYAFVSPVAPTPSKPGHGPALGDDGLRALVTMAGGMPVLALGGVTPANVPRWRAAGAAGAAVMGGVMAAPDPATVVRDLLDAWHATTAPPASTSFPGEEAPPAAASAPPSTSTSPHPRHLDPGALVTTPPVSLTIAGSDSGGGAGIQADLRAFGQMGTFGASVITAITAQNTTGVTDVHVVPTGTVTAQLDAVLSDLPVAAVKTGMLATAELVALVGDRAAAGELPQLVVDPVLVSATGHRLLDPDAVAVYRDRVLPHAMVITPNLDEAAVLVGRDLTSLDDAWGAAQELAASGARVVVVKGGHLEGPQAVDVVVADGERHELVADRIDTGNTHGTGCTFAAATAARLARGDDPLTALHAAKRYVTAAIAGAAPWKLGAGCGPVDHLGFGA